MIRRSLNALRGNLALNWMFKTWDIIAAAPLTDQLKAYEEIHQKRAMKVDDILLRLTRIEEKLERRQEDEKQENG